MREKRRRPSKHARIFGPITGIDGTEFIPCISRAGFRLPGKYGQNTGPCYPGVFPVKIARITSKEVLVPADKGINVLSVCKKILCRYIVPKEFDTCNGTSPQTYTSCSACVENLIKEHQHFIFQTI